ncbi:MAG: helix-turn-helix domain-containing protein [Dehalococcoidia bacterium]
MERLLTCGDAARVLSVVPDTVRAMERAGRLPAVRTLGGIRLFRREDIDRVAAERAQAQGKRPAAERRS